MIFSRLQKQDALILERSRIGKKARPSSPRFSPPKRNRENYESGILGPAPKQSNAPHHVQIAKLAKQLHLLAFAYFHYTFRFDGKT